MAHKRSGLLGMVLVMLFVTAACSSEKENSPTPPTEASTTNAGSSPAANVDTPSPTSDASHHASPPATAELIADVPPGLTLVDSTEDVVRPSDGEDSEAPPLQPTTIVSDGVYPYPTANLSIDSDGDGWYTVEELQEAVIETYPYYDWPESYHPSLEDILAIASFDRYPPGGEFEAPMEIDFLGSIQACAWQQNWLDAFAVGDQTEMDLSLAQLRASVLTNPAKDRGYAMYREMFDSAELGDPALLMRDLRLNCTGFNSWVESRSANVPTEYRWWLLVRVMVA